MAVSFVTNALGPTSSTTSFSITLPTTQLGDLIIVEFAHRGTGNGTQTGTFPETLSLKHSQLFASSAFSGKTYWARATGDHVGQTVGFSGLTNSCAGILTLYRGALSSGDPLAGATIVGEENASGNETQAEITTIEDNCWVVLVVVNSPDLAVATQACTSPGTLTERAERLSTGGTDSSIAHASAEKASAGATGALTWAQTDAASGSWAYAIRPQPLFTATGSPALNNLTAAGSAAHAQIASGTPALKKLATNASGIVQPDAGGASNLPNLLTSGSAQQKQIASGNPVLPGTNAAGTGNAAGGSAFRLIASPNVAVSGENTTAQLTPPSGKTTSDFGGGRIQDDENPTDTVDVGLNQYREDEWVIEATADAEADAVYEFEIVEADDTPLTLYNVNPRWTIAVTFAATGSPALPTLLASGAAIHEQIASGNPELPSLVAAAVGVMHPDATGAVALPTLVVSGTALQIYSGANASTLPNLLATGSATHKQSSAGSPALPNLVAAGSGTATGAASSASGVVTLPSLLGSGAALHKLIATGSPLLGNLTATGIATGNLTIEGHPALPSITASGTAEQSYPASGTLSLNNLIAAITGEIIHNASGNAVLPGLFAGFVTTPNAFVRVRITGDPTLPNLVSNGSVTLTTGVSGAATLPSLVAQGFAVGPVGISAQRGLATLVRVEQTVATLPLLVGRATVLDPVEGDATLPDISGRATVMHDPPGTATK